MTTKTLGPVSRYLEAEERSFDQIPFVQNRPVLDSELNLLQDVQSLARRKLSRAVMASGFVTGRNKYGPLNSNVDDANNESRSGDYLVNLASPVANSFDLVNDQIAWVNGYPIDMGDAVTVTLNAPPVGAGTLRVDLVYLEVWLALVDSTTANKDGSGNLFLNGNTEEIPANNLSDDIVDPAVTLETAKRVQIQWALRVKDDVDIFTYATGLDDPSVTAQANEASPTAFTFTNQADEGDPGLWIASGLPNTVDGFAYAVPIAAISRRNTTAWNRDTNANGGVLISAGTSDRPDSLFSDQIVERDIMDLRRSVTPSGFDFNELLEKNLSWLFDDKLRTNLQNNNLGGGQIGTSWTNADEIGPADTTGANKIGEFDGVQILYSDALQVTEYTFVVNLGDRDVGPSPTIWQSGDEFDLNLPGGTKGIITDFEGPITTNSGYQSGSFSVSDMTTTGITVKLNTDWDTDIPVGARTSTFLYCRVQVTFEATGGLSRYPTFYQEEFVTGSNVTTLEPGDTLVYETTPDAAFNGFTSRSGFYKPSRTAIMEARYSCGDLAITSLSSTGVELPWPVDTDISLPMVFFATDVGKTTDLFLSGGAVDDRLITFNDIGTDHADLIIDWQSREPVRETTAQITLYYETAAFQSIDPPNAGVDMIQRHLDGAIYTTNGGSGNDEPSFPYIRPGAQIPISNSAVVGGESALRGLGSITVDDFGSISQFLKVTDFIPLASVPLWRLRNRIADLDTGAGAAPSRFAYTDVEITPYSDESQGTPIAYQPTVFGQLLFNPTLHKTMYATIASLREDVDQIGKRGELFLLIYSRSANDQQNSVIFSASSEADSCVAIFRMKGNPLLPNTERHQS